MDIETILAKARAPQQGRSKASFERMLATAEELMTQRGSDEFTLNEVAKHGKVSIGSIYCRFDSKDDWSMSCSYGCWNEWTPTCWP